MGNVPTQIPGRYSDGTPFLHFFLSSDPSIYSTMAFPTSGNSDHVDASVSIDFPSQ